MKKLKTLKDLDVSEILYESNGSSSGALNVERAIKAEAIKDIKAIKKAEKEGDDFRINNFCFYCRECASSGHVIDYIMWKNNITSEDLK